MTVQFVYCRRIIHEIVYNLRIVSQILPIVVTLLKLNLFLVIISKTALCTTHNRTNIRYFGELNFDSSRISTFFLLLLHDISVYFDIYQSLRHHTVIPDVLVSELLCTVLLTYILTENDSVSTRPN